MGMRKEIEKINRTTMIELSSFFEIGFEEISVQDEIGLLDVFKNRDRRLLINISERWERFCEDKIKALQKRRRLDERTQEGITFIDGKITALREAIKDFNILIKEATDVKERD